MFMIMKSCVHELECVAQLRKGIPSISKPQDTTHYQDHMPERKTLNLKPFRFETIEPSKTTPQNKKSTLSFYLVAVIHVRAGYCAHLLFSNEHQKVTRDFGADSSPCDSSYQHAVRATLNSDPSHWTFLAWAVVHMMLCERHVQSATMEPVAAASAYCWRRSEDAS